MRSSTFTSVSLTREVLFSNKRDFNLRHILYAIIFHDFSIVNVHAVLIERMPRFEIEGSPLSK